MPAHRSFRLFKVIPLLSPLQAVPAFQGGSTSFEAFGVVLISEWLLGSLLDRFDSKAALIVCYSLMLCHFAGSKRLTTEHFVPYASPSRPRR